MTTPSRYPLPDTGYLRLKQILGDPKANPPVPPIIPVGKSSWWAGIKDRRYPAGYKLGRRATGWKVEDIRQLVADIEAQAKAAS